MNQDVLRNLAPGLWVADRALPVLGSDIGTRMTVVRLDDGGLFLHSPVRLDPATRSALDDLGPVRAVVAPSKAHHLFAGDYPSAYPEAKLFGAPGLACKRKDLRFDAELSDEAPELWKGQLDQLMVRGAPYMNEVVFLHKATRTLVLTDLAFNVPKNKVSGARLFYWLVGAAGKFGPHRIIRWGFRDKAAARKSIDQILEWNFDRVTVTHGEVLETGGKEAMRKAFAYL